MDVFSLSFIFFFSNETELIKIIHMQAFYRSQFDVDERRLEYFTSSLFLLLFYLVLFFLMCFFFSCTLQIFRFPLLLFFHVLPAALVLLLVLSFCS